jgi:putative transposase
MKAAIEQVQGEYAFTERRACALLLVAAGTYRYQSRRRDEPLRTRLVELAREKPRFGYRRLQVLLSRAGERVNHKRLHRIYRAAGLTIRRKKRKHCTRAGQPLLQRRHGHRPHRRPRQRLRQPGSGADAALRL